MLRILNPIPTGLGHVTLIYGLIPPMAGRNRVNIAWFVVLLGVVLLGVVLLVVVLHVVVLLVVLGLIGVVAELIELPNIST